MVLLLIKIILILFHQKSERNKLILPRRHVMSYKKSSKACKVSVCWILILCFLCLPISRGLGVEVQMTSTLQKSIQYLHDVQNNDGGFPALPGKSSDDSVTAWTLMALGCMDEDVSFENWQKDGKSPLDFLAAQQENWKVTTDIARTVLALSLSGTDPTRFAGRNLIDELKCQQNENGQFAQEGEEDLINAHVWTVLALSVAGEVIPNRDRACDWLIKQQNEDGGFSFAVGLDSDVDDTAAAIQSLAAMKADQEVIDRALAFIKSAQHSDGGFGWQSLQGNAASDGWVLQALYAAGENPTDITWIKDGKDVIDHLMILQNSKGSFNWQQDINSSPVMMTAQAVIGLSGCTFSQIKDNLFNDVPQGYWAEDAIYELANQGVISGYQDGSFKPEGSVTRAEFAKLLLYSLGKENLVDDKTSQFKDLPDTHWANAIIKVAVDARYLQGYPEALFKPQNGVSGAEVMTILVRVLGKEDEAKLYTGTDWYEGYVKVAGENGLLYPEFNALSFASRGQCAYALRQMQLSR